MLIIYKDIEDISDDGSIESIHHANPVEVIQLIKQVNNIKLGDDWYKYESCEFIPTADNIHVDVLHIYVELIGELV